MWYRGKGGQHLDHLAMRTATQGFDGETLFKAARTYFARQRSRQSQHRYPILFPCGIRQAAPLEPRRNSAGSRVLVRPEGWRSGWTASDTFRSDYVLEISPVLQKLNFSYLQRDARSDKCDMCGDVATKGAVVFGRSPAEMCHVLV